MSLTTAVITADDGTALAVHQTGDGRPLLLLHGYMSSAATNWVRYGHAALLADAGFRVIMPDLRGHGESGAPIDPAFYPPDVLAADALRIVAALGLGDYDLGGYSLGGRTVARMLVKGARPRRAVIAGMGLDGLTAPGSRADFFRRVLGDPAGHRPGSPEYLAAAFLKTTGGNPAALRALLDSFVDTPVAALAAFDLPVAVVCGSEDADNGSAAALADALPDGRLVTIPGNHMSAVTKPALGQAIADFLTA